VAIAAKTESERERAIATGRRVMAIEAAALGQFAGLLGDAFADAVELMLSARGRIIVSGMGKSGHVAHKIAATMASTGTPAQFVHPAEASHGDRPPAHPDAAPGQRHVTDDRAPGPDDDPGDGEEQVLKRIESEEMCEIPERRQRRPTVFRSPRASLPDPAPLAQRESSRGRRTPRRNRGAFSPQRAQRIAGATSSRVLRGEDCTLPEPDLGLTVRHAAGVQSRHRPCAGSAMTEAG